MIAWRVNEESKVVNLVIIIGGVAFKNRQEKNVWGEIQWGVTQPEACNDKLSILGGKISAQPHTIVKQICFPNGNVLFLSLFSLSKNRMHDVV